MVLTWASLDRGAPPESRSAGDERPALPLPCLRRLAPVRSTRPAMDPTPPAKIDCSIHPPFSRSPARFHGTSLALNLIGEKRATLIDVFPAEFACWTSCSERTAALFERALSFGFRPNPCEKSANPIISLLLPRGLFRSAHAGRPLSRKDPRSLKFFGNFPRTKVPGNYQGILPELREFLLKNHPFDDPALRDNRGRSN